MNIPCNVKIAGLIFDVHRTHGVHNGTNKAYGTCDHTQTVIQIEGEYSIQKQKQTLLHEIIHAIDEEYKIGLKENQVDQVACGLYSLIVDNPDMFKEGE